MIINSFCNKENSIKLKKLGYDYPCSAKFFKNGNVKHESCSINYNVNKGWVSVPLLQEALRFLHEKHKLHIMIDCNASGWYYNISKIDTGTVIIEYEEIHNESGYFSDYHDCFNESINKTLDYIIYHNISYII